MSDDARLGPEIDFNDPSTLTGRHASDAILIP
jgi:hypothetical protein